jgi:YesN/AraC family two-component response regulator
MPGMDGLELLRQIKKVRPTTDVVMITGFGTIDNAVEAMKIGAKDYIQKPFKMSHIKGIIEDINHEKRYKTSVKPIVVMDEMDKFDSLKTFKDLLVDDRPGLWITSIVEGEEVKEKDGSITYLNISPKEEKGTIHPKNIYKIKEFIKDYLETNSNAVVMMDCLDLLIATHTNETILKFMTMLEEWAINNNTRTLISINKHLLTNDTVKDIRYIISSSYIQVMADSLSNPLRRRIVRHLKKTPSSFSTILSYLPNTESAKLSFHLQKLINDGIIEKDGQKKYFLTARGNKALGLMESMELEGITDKKNLITLSIE